MAFAAIGGTLVSSALGAAGVSSTWAAVGGAAASGLIGSAVGGSGGGGSGSTETKTRRVYDPFETRANNAANQITRGTWDYAKQFYHPLENELIARSQKINEDEVHQRGKYAQQATKAEWLGNLRDLGRQGVTMSGQQKAYLERMRQLGISTNRAYAQNSDRLAQLDRNRNVLATLAGFGRSSLASAQQASGAAAGMESSRNTQGGYTDISESTTSQKVKSGGGGGSI